MIFTFLPKIMKCFGNYSGPGIFFNVIKNIQGLIIWFDLGILMGFTLFFISCFLRVHFSTLGKE